MAAKVSAPISRASLVPDSARCIPRVRPHSRRLHRVVSVSLLQSGCGGRVWDCRDIRDWNSVYLFVGRPPAFLGCKAPTLGRWEPERGAATEQATEGSEWSSRFPRTPCDRRLAQRIQLRHV